MRTNKQTDRQTYEQKYIHRDMRMNKQTDGHMKKQTTDRHLNKNTDTETWA
jgi:hypothetical protein